MSHSQRRVVVCDIRGSGEQRRLTEGSIDYNYGEVRFDQLISQIRNNSVLRSAEKCSAALCNERSLKKLLLSELVCSSIRGAAVNQCFHVELQGGC